MSYKFFEDVAIADIAFEAYGKTLEEMFESSAFAVVNTMVEKLNTIKQKIKKEIIIKSDNIDNLLFNFLQEIIFYKDSENILFSKIDENKNELHCLALGEELDMKKHNLIVDVKAITFHRFSVKKYEDGWKSQIIIDI